MNTLLLRNRIINHGPIMSYLELKGFKLVKETYNPLNFEAMIHYENEEGVTMVFYRDHIKQNPNFLEQHKGFWLDIK